MLSFGRWAERISGDASKGKYWKTIFDEHPEFFRLDRARELASLVWRRQYPKRFHVDRAQQLYVEQYEALTQDEEQRGVSRSTVTFQYQDSD